MSISLQAERTKRLCLDALFLCVALMLSYLESTVPIPIPLPAFRLGLANVAVVMCFCLFSPLDAAIVSGCRVLIMGVLFGSVTSLYFSAMGAFFAFLMLCLLSRVGHGCSFVGVSVLCAAAHNAGQTAAAMTLFGASWLFSYLPWLLLASLLFGSITGTVLNLTFSRIQHLLGGKRT